MLHTRLLSHSNSSDIIAFEESSCRQSSATTCSSEFLPASYATLLDILDRHIDVSPSPVLRAACFGPGFTQLSGGSIYSQSAKFMNLLAANWVKDKGVNTELYFVDENPSVLCATNSDRYPFRYPISFSSYSLEGAQLKKRWIKHTLEKIPGSDRKDGESFDADYWERINPSLANRITRKDYVGNIGNITVRPQSLTFLDSRRVFCYARRLASNPDPTTPHSIPLGKRVLNLFSHTHLAGLADGGVLLTDSNTTDRLRVALQQDPTLPEYKATRAFDELDISNLSPNLQQQENEIQRRIVPALSQLLGRPLKAVILNDRALLFKVLRTIR